MSQQTEVKKEVEDALIAKAQRDQGFRQALIKNTKATIEKEFGISMPQDAQLIVVEETASICYLVLPALADGEMSDAELVGVAGGGHLDALRRQNALEVHAKLYGGLSNALRQISRTNENIIKNIK